MNEDTPITLGMLRDALVKARKSVDPDWRSETTGYGALGMLLIEIDKLTKRGSA